MGQEDKPVVDREGLKSFLLEEKHNGVTEAEIDKAMETIGGLFIQAEREQFQFTPADEVNREAIVRAIALATGREVKEVELLSVSEPFKRPEWMSEAAYLDSLSGSLGGSLWDSLGLSLWSSLGGSLGNNLWESLRVSLSGSLGDSLEDSLRVSLRASLWASLFFYLSFVLIGKKDEAARLAPLVRLSAVTPPVAWLKNQPDVPLILVA